jgi:hypothetical protein
MFLIAMYIIVLVWFYCITTDPPCENGLSEGIPGGLDLAKKKIAKIEKDKHIIPRLEEPGMSHSSSFQYTT